MASVTISAEKIEKILGELRKAKRGEPADLTPYLPALIAGFNTLAMLFELLHRGGVIDHVRKLLGVQPSRKKSEPEDSIDDEKTGTGDAVPSDKTPASAPKPETTPDTEPKQESSAQNTAERSADQNDSSAPGRGKRKNPNHGGRAGFDDFPDAPTCTHRHDDLKPGDLCPECEEGKVIESEPRQRLQFVGQPPITPIRHIFEDLICDVCKTVFRASATKEAIADGLDQGFIYGHSAVALIAVFKFFSALPYYRLARVNGMLGANIPTSSQFDQIERLSNALKPIQQAGIAFFAQTRLAMADDATARILERSQALIADRKTGKVILRDGCHSSVAIGFDDEIKNIILLIKTDIIHSGEWLDQLFTHRRADLPKPHVVWDRCASNTLTVCPYNDFACNQHARHNFKEIKDQLPALARPILDLYERIFANDVLTAPMTPSERLAFHQQHSARDFDTITAMCQNVLSANIIPDNSNFRKPFEYQVKHQKELRGFLEYEGIPLSNNLVERLILYLVLIRRVTHFYRTRVSAAIADIILSVGLTAFLNRVNLVKFFTNVLRHQDEVAKNPEDWLAWNYLKRFPEHEVKYKTRSKAWPASLAGLPYIPISPPK